MKKKKKAAHRQRHQKQRKHGKPVETTAIVPAMPAPIAHWKERTLSREKVDLLKRTVAKGTDDDQFMLFLQVCQRHGLDPFAKEVYCVLFPTSKHHQDEKGIWVGGHEMVIITGIGGYRKMAARDHKDYAGSSDGKFAWFNDGRKTPAGRLIPESATVQIFRRGSEATVATVYWEEFAPADLRAPRSDFWNRMPKNQLEKCAEAKGLRKAFPGLGDIFTEEEMSQRFADLTPGGRQISIDGVAPSGHVIEQYSREAAQRVLAEKLAPKPIQPEITSHGAAVREEPAQQKPAEAPKEYRGTVEVDQSIEADPIVRGDLGDLVPFIEKYCTAKFHDGWWHILPRDLETIFQMCEQLGYKVVEILPKSTPPPAKSSPSHSTAPAKATGAPSTDARQKPGPASANPSAKQNSAGPVLVKGIIERVFTTTTQNKTPMRQVTILMPDKKKPTFGCFDKALFDYLDKAKGEIEAYVIIGEKYNNLVGLKRIVTTAGVKEFDLDGKTPVIQRKDQEAGGRTLFGA